MDLVSIAGLAPKDFKDKFPNYRRYESLVPPKQLVLDYKSTKITKKEYTRVYKEQIFKLDPFNVYNDLKDSIILCWEKPGQFCHRILVANWIFSNTGIKVEEL
jgi:hypothetical protein